MFTLLNERPHKCSPFWRSSPVTTSQRRLRASGQRRSGGRERCTIWGRFREVEAADLGLGASHPRDRDLQAGMTIGVAGRALEGGYLLFPEAPDGQSHDHPLRTTLHTGTCSNKDGLRFVPWRSKRMSPLHPDPAPLLAEIRTLVQAARLKAVRQVNTLIVSTRFEIGRRIVHHEQEGEARAQYGKAVLQNLSEALTTEFGRGWSVDNISLMRRFYRRIETGGQFPRHCLGFLTASRPQQVRGQQPQCPSSQRTRAPSG